jgi:hypothetical protein
MGSEQCEGLSFGSSQVGPKVMPTNTIPLYMENIWALGRNDDGWDHYLCLNRTWDSPSTRIRAVANICMSGGRSGEHAYRYDHTCVTTGTGKG